MKSPEFQYKCPSSLEDALAHMANAEYECQPLAGGQSLMPMMNLRLAGPDVLVDLNRLTELNFIGVEKTHVCIGAMVRYSDLMDSKIVHQHIPLFMQALPYIAHEAVRNRGTIGGSVALADPAAEMPALLIALDASITVISDVGKRQVPADEFFIGVYETALEQGELVHSISIPIAHTDQRFGFYELARRHGDYAMAGVVIAAASVNPYADLRIVFFSVADRALRAIAAETILNGEQFSEALVSKARLTLASIEFNEDLNASEATKKHLAGVCMQRALASMNAGTQ